MSKVVSLEQVRRDKFRKKIIAQYISFYGTTYDYERKKAINHHYKYTSS